MKQEEGTEGEGRQNERREVGRGRVRQQKEGREEGKQRMSKEQDWQRATHTLHLFPVLPFTVRFVANVSEALRKLMKDFPYTL